MKKEGSNSAPKPSRDRSGGLLICGWVLIAAGAFSLLVALLPLALLTLPRGAPGAPPMAVGGIVFNVALYLLLAGALVALGVGSIHARRWARTLTVILAWVWLAVGLLAAIATALILPAAISQQAGVPSGMGTCVLVFTLLFLALFFVCLPGVLILFYRREDVRATVEAKSPRPDWTDRVSPSILGVVLALVLGGVASVCSGLAFRAVPIFGVVLTGWTAVAVMLAFAGISAALAVGVYRRAPAAWWGLLLLQVAGLANIFSLSAIDISELMRRMGYSSEQAEFSGKLELFRRPGFLVLVLSSWLLLLGFILSIRKHFRPGFTAGSSRLD